MTHRALLIFLKKNPTKTLALKKSVNDCEMGVVEDDIEKPVENVSVVEDNLSADASSATAKVPP